MFWGKADCCAATRCNAAELCIADADAVRTHQIRCGGGGGGGGIRRHRELEIM